LLQAPPVVLYDQTHGEDLYTGTIFASELTKRGYSVRVLNSEISTAWRTFAGSLNSIGGNFAIDVPAGVPNIIARVTGISFWHKIELFDPDGKLRAWGMSEAHVHNPVKGNWRVNLYSEGSPSENFVLTVGTGPYALSTQNLVDVSVLVIASDADRPDSNLQYSPDEVRAVTDFVHNGGGMFVMGQFARGWRIAANDVLSNFPIKFREGTVIDAKHNWGEVFWPVVRNFAVHPVTEGISRILYSAGCAVVLSNPSSTTALAWTDQDAWLDLGGGDNQRGPNEPQGNITVLASYEGAVGRIVAFGDGIYESPDTQIMQSLFLNTIAWLVRSGPTSRMTSSTITRTSIQPFAETTSYYTPEIEPVSAQTYFVDLLPAIVPTVILAVLAGISTILWKKKMTAGLKRLRKRYGR